MKTKKLLSLLLAMTMIFSMMSFSANAAEGHCDDEANCLVCKVADLINALPVAEEITVDNAAAVTNQIHAIDRIKFDLTDDEYDELLTLVEEGTDESGQGLGVPVRYAEAVNAINELGGGGWLAIGKKFVAGDSEVDVTNAEVQFKVTNVDTNATTTLTMATLGTQTSALGEDYYEANADGWTYKYMLPAGTYCIEEVSDSGATVNGEEFVTGVVSFDGDVGESITVEVEENSVAEVWANNGRAYTFWAQDVDGNYLSGVHFQIIEPAGNVSAEWDSSETEAYTEAEEYLSKTGQYTLLVTNVPEGYGYPDPYSVAFTPFGDGSEFTGPFSHNNYTVTVTIPKQAVAETHSHPVCGATCAGDHDGTYGNNDGHTENVTYTALSSVLTLDETTDTYSGSLTTSGSYYLDKDITLSSALAISVDVNLCLAGRKLTLSDEIKDSVISQTSGILNICDCNEANGSWKFSVNETIDTDNFGLWTLDDAGSKTVSGGIITGGYGRFYRNTQGGYPVKDTTYYQGGAIYSTNSTLNMYGGNIVGNGMYTYYSENLGITAIDELTAGGIYIDKSDFNLYGGVVQGNTCIDYGGGIRVEGEGSTFNMYGGLVNGNTSTEGYGGGISIDDNITFNMYGGEISENQSWAASFGGGGIHISSATANLYNGLITKNYADGYGGGLYAYNTNAVLNIYDGTEISYNKCEYGAGMQVGNGVANMYGGKIVHNEGSLAGAGVRVYRARFIFHDGLIASNTLTHVAGDGAGVWAASDNAEFTMNGGEISGNTATGTASSGGGVYVGYDTTNDTYRSIFNLNGGKIINNSAKEGGGVYYYPHGIFNLAADAENCNPIIITGNKTNSNELSNLYCYEDDDISAILTVGNYLNLDSDIGILTYVTPTLENPVQFTNGGADYVDLFSSDAANTIVEKTANGTGLQLRMLDVNERTITVNENIEHGSISVDASIAHGGDTVTITATPNENYVIDTVTVTKTDGSSVDVTVDAEDETKFTFTMPADNVTVSATFKDKTYTVNISSNFIGGTVTADVTEAKLGDVVTLTATPVGGYEFTSITVTDAEGDVIPEKVAEVALFAENEFTNYAFEMPASDVTVDAVFTKKTIENVYTVNAVVDETVTTDKRDTTEGMDVYAGDTVKVDVVVNGADYTNADWTLVYDYSKFAFDHYELNTAYGDTGYITHDETNADKGVIIGYARGFAGETAGDEFVNGEYIVSYYFTALPQLIEVTGKFNITSAHVNNYEMAGIQDNTAATSNAVDVTIILITDDDGDDAKTPAGSIEAAEKVYNALEQSGNEYVLDTEFEDATVTYAANADGSAVTDTTDADGNGVADAIEALTFKTGLPTWKNVGTYTYYVKISGDGLATIYDSTTLTITPATLTPSATFAVDPAVDKVTIIPELQGVLDGSHNGQVTVTYTDKDGVEQTETLEASNFIYDGESTSVYNGVIEVEAQQSGIFTVTLDYTEGENDNYIGVENTAEIDVDKLTADDATIKALEDAIESVFPYDSVEHFVEIGELPEGWTYETPVDAYDETTENPSVTNVGDEKLVKVVFTDTTGVYNDVVVYVVLKVTPAKVTITLDNKSKAVGEADPEFTYKVEIYDNDGNFVQTGLYGEDETAMAIEPERTPGETAGTYPITASYVPNANYEVTVVDGTLTIGAPSTEGDDADVKIEVVDLSNNEPDGTPDYVAGKRLVLVYTNLDKAYYGYGTADNYEKMFDVTGAGYKYVDNDYSTGTLVATGDDTKYAHVYGIVVDKIADFEATEDHEALYRNNVIFLGSDAEDAPENIVYDADINLTKELDVNDYSMNNGIYNIDNIKYDRVTYMKSILKADYDHDKVVDTTDSRAVKDIVDTAKVVTE